MCHLPGFFISIITKIVLSAGFFFTVFVTKRLVLCMGQVHQLVYDNLLPPFSFAKYIALLTIFLIYILEFRL